MQLTIFYDGNCPLCVAEMDLLRQYDQHGRLRLEDINTPEFNTHYPQVDVMAANQILHGLTAEGQMLYGLNVTVNAWLLVGKKKWIKVLRWPVIAWFADKIYLLFARNRYFISGLLTGQNYCSQQWCTQKTKQATSTAKCSLNVSKNTKS